MDKKEEYKLEFVEKDDGSIVFQMEQGSRLVLPPEIADEIWEMREKAHARQKILGSLTAQGDDTIDDDIFELCEAYIEERDEIELALLEQLVKSILLKRAYDILEDEYSDLEQERIEQGVTDEELGILGNL